MSRLPPLPPGMPPRPSGPTGSYGGDSYRPQNDNHRSQNENYRDQRGNENYRPQNPPPMYEFRGSYDRCSHGYAPGTEPIRGAGDTYRPREGPRDGDFTFRYDAPGPTAMKFGNAETYRPRSPPLPRSPPRLRERARDNGSQYRPGQRGGRGNYRGRGGPRLASEREFLKGNRAPTPELMPGMDEDDGHGVRYMPVEDVSDSDEVEMDLSEDENDDTNQPKKKHVRTETRAVDADQAPRWSNPDPYTALPPPDESLRKKKDVVKLIRKARVNAISENTSKAEAAADDFISLGFGDESEDDYEPPTQMGHGVAGAPTGPRSAQRDNNYESSYEQHPEPKAALLNRMPRDAQTPPSKVSSKTAAIVDLTPDPTLGNRKRNIRDEIKGPPMIHDTTKGKRPPSDGSIVRAWVAPKGSSGTPWVNIDHSDTPKIGVWLHKEIWDFYYHVKPRDFEHFIRTKLVEDLRNKVRDFYGDADIRTFGSFPAGLYLPTADMDLVLVSDQFMRGGRAKYGQSRNEIFKFANFLRQQDIPIKGSVDCITKARVPLVKYVDNLTGLKVDISFENDTGLIAIKTFQDWKTEFPAMPILVTLIKHLLCMRGLNEPVNGGIGGFSVTCLVVSLLQNMPQVQSGNMIPEHHLGEILMEFLKLYGKEFNTTTTAISFKPPGYISKAHLNITYKGPSEKFSIIDPNNPENDIAGGSSNTRIIRQCFYDAYERLQERMGSLQQSASAHRRNQSILGCILAGNYNSFHLQRQHLAHVHEKLFGPVTDD